MSNMNVMLMSDLVNSVLRVGASMYSTDRVLVEVTGTQEILDVLFDHDKSLNLLNSIFIGLINVARNILAFSKSMIEFQ